MTRVPLSEIHPAPWNPRLIKDHRFEQLCNSIVADPNYVFKKYDEGMFSSANLFLKWLEGHAALIVQLFQNGMIDVSEGSPYHVKPT